MKLNLYLSRLKSLTCCLVAAGAAGGLFAASSSTYTGLFYEMPAEGDTNLVWQQSAGYVTITTTSRGKYSGKLQLGPKSYAFSGYLSSSNGGFSSIPRRDDYPLTVEFQIDPNDADLITGTVSDGNWVADMYVDRAVFDGKYSISPDTGKYTLLIPGDFTRTSEPGGDSYGTVTVDKAGRLRFAGSLADGTKVSQSTRVSKNGQWPLYASLYHGDGALYAWMLLNPSVDKELDGEVTWICPETPWTRYYPNGFAISLQAWGSRYVTPARGQKILDITSASIEFNGGNPAQSVTNRVMLDSYNRVANHSDNPLTMKFSTSNGLFNGKVWSRDSESWVRFQGVVLQGYNIAGGYFLGWDQSGEVWVQAPAEPGPSALKPGTTF